ncbi:MAG: glycine betaine ABC transporter substrate-binding protein [bacterium]|nr:glycine betaine ABC transporter substrate-binding protein [bacterium]
MRDRRRPLTLLSAVLGFALAFSPGQAIRAQEAARERPLVVAAKKFPESVVLAEVLAQLSERELGRTVVRKMNMGNTAILFESLKAGKIDIYPEYTGTALLSLKRGPKKRTSAAVRLAVERGMREEHGLYWGPPLGFNNTYALGLRGAIAREHNVSSISDLVRLQETGAGVRFAVTHEFLGRDDGWDGLRAAYGLGGTPRGVEHGLAYELFKNDEADVIDLYSTEGLIALYDMVVLEDDRNFWPPYDASYIYGPKVANDAALLGVIGRISGRFDDETMRRLNYAVEVAGRSVEEVVREFLDRGFVAPVTQVTTSKGIPAPSRFRSRREMSFFEMVAADRYKLARYTGEHLAMTLTALAFAIIVGVPLGLLAIRNRAIAAVTIGGAGILQTIPSLALLVFMIPLFAGSSSGGWNEAVTALFLYALLPIIRNTKQGIEDVDPPVLDAAKGMGMTGWQRLRYVTMPLALPVILAGIRTAAVITVGTAVLAAFIGAGGLGTPILAGLSVQNMTEVLTGAALAATLALAIDCAFSLLQRAVSPVV